jgi:hypothetical protein
MLPLSDDEPFIRDELLAEQLSVYEVAFLDRGVISGDHVLEQPVVSQLDEINVHVSSAFYSMKMSVPHRHVNLVMIKRNEAQNPQRNLSLAAAKSGHTFVGKPFGSKYDRNFHNEYSEFHAMPKKTALMNEVHPRKVIKKAK